jgi:hypothetical protein
VDLLDGCGNELEEIGLGKMLLDLGLLNVSIPHVAEDLLDLQPQILHLFLALKVCVFHVGQYTDIWFWV